MPTIYNYVLGRPKAQQEIIEVSEETPVEVPAEAPVDSTPVEEPAAE